MADENSQAPPIVREALAFVKYVLEVEGNQRKRELEDLAFQLPDNQWDDAAKEARKGAIIGGVQVPPRPMISIPKLDQPIGSVLNQEKAAHLGVNVHPISEDADDDTAEVQQDLYRMIERDSRAGLARSWAFDRAVKAGRGAYRVLTVYDDDSDNPTDQKIVIRRMVRQEMAFFDPAAEEPDWCDGKKAAVGAWQPLETFKRNYPSSKLKDYGESELAALMQTEPDWVRGEGEKRAVFVLEFYRVKELTDSVTVTDRAGKRVTRPKTTRTVEWVKVNAIEELEPLQEINGRYIPLIPVIGRELQPFDQERRWIGMVRPARDACKLFNAAASNALETAATEPKAKHLLYDGQQEGHEAMWQQANVRNFPYLLINKEAVDRNGTVLPHPVLTQADTSKLQISLMLLEKAEGFIQAATSNTDPMMMERLARKKVAHQTLDALQEQGDFGKSDYLHNLAECSMTYEAKVVLDLMASVYDRQGRVVRLITGENKPRTVMLNQPFYVDPQTKRPKPARGPQPQGVKVLTYDLTKGKYTSSVEIGKNWKTRVSEGSDRLGEILAKEPAMMPVLGPLWFQFQDFPGAKEAMELLKKMRAMQFPGIDDDPEDSAQQLQQMQGQFRAVQEQLKQAMQYIEQERAKHEADIQKEHIKAENAIVLQEMKNASAIQIAEIQAQIKGVSALLDAEQERIALHQTQTHEAMQGAADRSHEWDLAEEQHRRAQELTAQQAELGMVAAEQGQAHALEQGEQGHGQALEQQQQAADLAPEPEPAA